MVDGSRSIHSGHDFPAMKKFVGKMITFLDMKKVRVGVVQFSNRPRIEFQLGQHASLASLQSRINGLRQIRGSTSLASSLKLVRTRMFGTRSDRRNAKNILLVLTDGKTRGYGAARREALLLRRRKDTLVMVVSVGNPKIIRRYRMQRRALASAPWQRNSIDAGVNKLLSIIRGLVQKMCGGMFIFWGLKYVDHCPQCYFCCVF